MITITNKLIIEEAKKAGIDYQIVSEKYNLVLLTYEGEEKLICRSRIPETSGAFSYIADNKEATYDVMEYYNLSYPKSLVTKNTEDIQKAIDMIGYPLVVKPQDGSAGNGVTVNLKTKEQIEHAFDIAKKYSDRVIIQKYIPGDDYRIIVVGYKVLGVTKRVPAHIFGDGENTIKHLIDRENTSPLRTENYQSPLTKIEIDDDLIEVLEENNMTLDFIPKENQHVEVRSISNLSKGGEAESLISMVPEENIKLFEKMAYVLKAFVVGIDIRAQDVTKILSPEDYAVIEVNASPGIRMHHYPSKGEAFNVAKAFLEAMFPNAFAQ